VPLGEIAPTLESLVSRDQVGELETDGFRPQLHPPLGYASEGGDPRDQLRACAPAMADVGKPGSSLST
jgi:hypothetical protein